MVSPNTIGRSIHRRAASLPFLRRQTSEMSRSQRDSATICRVERLLHRRRQRRTLDAAIAPINTKVSFTPAWGRRMLI
jgi:hypothetical protein